MPFYNLAHGGDVHYNPNSELYPQNIYIEGKPEYGNSTSLLKPAGHWEGGYFSEPRDFRFNDPYYDIQHYKIGQKLALGDNILTNALPHMSILQGVHFVVWGAEEGVTFDVKLAKDGTVLGSIDASTANDGYFALAEPLYVDGTSNDGIVLEITGWVEPSTESAEEGDDCIDPTECCVPNDVCFTITPFYYHFRGENPCKGTCYQVGRNCCA